MSPKIPSPSLLGARELTPDCCWNPQSLLANTPYENRGVGISLPGVWGCPQIYPSPTKGCRGLPAGGLGVSPNLSLPPTKGCRGKVPAGGLGVSPNLSLLPKRGAGVSLPGVWGCPPIYPFLPKWGCRGLPAGGLGVSPNLSLSPFPFSRSGAWGLALTVRGTYRPESDRPSPRNLLS